MSEHEWSGDQVAEFVAEFVAAHANTAVWTLTGDADAADRLSDDARARLDRDARAFADAHKSDLVTWLTPGQAGYDLWLTRSGEGTGYWARYLPNDPAEMFSADALRNRRDPVHVAKFDAAMGRLSDAARALGGLDLYVGDDGLIHV